MKADIGVMMCFFFLTTQRETGQNSGDLKVEEVQDVGHCGSSSFSDVVHWEKRVFWKKQNLPLLALQLENDVSD